MINAVERGGHKMDDDKDLVMHPLKSSPIPRRFRGRKRIGWLAHYNAACFYSLALLLNGKNLPRRVPRCVPAACNPLCRDDVAGAWRRGR
jgi:hypothetical protein